MANTTPTSSKAADPPKAKDDDDPVKIISVGADGGYHVEVREGDNHEEYFGLVAGSPEEARKKAMAEFTKKFPIGHKEA